MLIVLRGPLPSCDVRAQRRIDAKAGANAVRLTKVIRPRRAVPGHYLVTVYVDSFPQVRKVVGITGKRARLLGTAAIDEALALCSAPSSVTAALGDGPDGSAGGSQSAGERSGSQAAGSPPPVDVPRARVLSFFDIGSGDRLNPVLAVVIGLALGALLLAGLGGMAAFVRGRTRSV